ncbi:hypothetical protein GFY24_26190 [Nocardia sp. SYP-A9097]|uniref:hypothetical protein n=1 Tax=Nocardia sp. SYP-A9097 TaxID=2663237 RepID=UPI00129AB456|nr:hypothetical protein [Nocardia sp. SYP-A9097]MRH90887.1 hypothetical protein [Nocardia sp. SYP-A9097]
MTNPFAYTSRVDRPAVYHGLPALDVVYSESDIERHLADHREQCETDNCPMLRHLQYLKSQRAVRKRPGRSQTSPGPLNLVSRSDL